MKRTGFAILVMSLITIALLVILEMQERGEARSQLDATLPQTCRNIEFEGVAYIVCEVDLREHDLRLRHRDDSGKAYGSLAELAKRQPFLFAMNAGMYHADMSAVGLYVEDGVERAPINLAEGEGNFFLKPNGVFFVDTNNHAGVMETHAFAATRPSVRLATQSGPMLVIDGAIHPRFEPNGASRYIRNGVGMRDEHVAIFAISRNEVSLGSFARLFRDQLGCRNALFFDGAISALHDGTRYLVGGGFPVGPIVAVVAKQRIEGS